MLNNLLSELKKIEEWQSFFDNIEKESSQYDLSKIFANIQKSLADKIAEGEKIFPAPENIFNAFKLSSFENTKVVILGQDPYHDENQAYGLAFAVPNSLRKLPPSLRNIYKELATDIGCVEPNCGELNSWAKQGVLLINAVLTVTAHKANSHKNIGWEDFTDIVIAELSRQKEHLVFVLWGANAISKKSLIDFNKHSIIESVHPSPLSAYRGFFGSRPFSRINNELKKYQLEPISWQITNNEELF